MNILNGQSEIFNQTVLNIVRVFSGLNAWYLLAPAVILLVFLVSIIYVSINNYG